MTYKRAIEHLERRVQWLDKKGQEHPDHSYIMAELSATQLAIEVLQEKAKSNAGNNGTV
jgi:hypothetical protein